ncbi:PP2C family protein-serine/threonine phosphatase [Nakamurella leprariae]|uniref:SpoIIE family protein phosphatase n=1 Tax=Nakamurella leprariae TaxID=2803911 RepID=A0A938Y9N5_9ACTN|nr:SpoIIE family protein phosphatase [Nakamurella leprariae]MBM9465739.1 SpoIIE family protein phosphatase [Nakamurella leprariae]
MHQAPSSVVEVDTAAATSTNGTATGSGIALTTGAPGPSEAPRRTSGRSPRSGPAALTRPRIRASLRSSGATPAGHHVATLHLRSPQASGDWCDWFIDHDTLTVTLTTALVRGRAGVSANATARAALRADAGSGAGDHTGDHPADRLGTAFAAAHRELMPRAAFVTAFAASVDAAGRVGFVDAGHGLTLLVRADGTRSLLGTHSLPLGMWEGSTWPVRSVHLQPGDVLLAFNDAVLDLFTGDLAGVPLLAQMVRDEGTPQRVLDRLARAAGRAAADRGRRDGTPAPLLAVCVRRDAVPSAPDARSMQLVAATTRV